MLASQKLAIAAHMHVLLRRKTGRVTDTEWMAQNLEYALEIVRFARAKAEEDRLPELREWADKLETAALAQTDTGVQQPLVQAAVQLLRDRGEVASSPAPVETPLAERTGGFAASSSFKPSGFKPSGFADSQHEPEKTKRDPAAPRYVGGIR